MGAGDHARLSEALLLAAGAEIRIRPMRPKDRAGIAYPFLPVGLRESHYRRFLGPKRELTDRELVFFTDIDHTRHEALAVVDQRDCSVVGVVRSVRYIDRPRVAAVAFEVADASVRR